MSFSKGGSSSSAKASSKAEGVEFASNTPVKTAANENAPTTEAQSLLTPTADKEAKRLLGDGGYIGS